METIQAVIIAILILGWLLIYRELSKTKKVATPKRTNVHFFINPRPVQKRSVRTCEFHSGYLNAGQLALIDNNNCDFCGRKAS